MIILLLLSSAQLRLWIMQIHLFHRLHDSPGDDEVAVPFVTRGYEVPRCPFRAGLVQSVLVRLHVLFPEFSFRKIVTTELPPLGRIVQALLQPLLLLVLVNVKVEFQYRRVLFGEYPLEIVNLPVSMAPDFFRNDLVNSLDKNAFVMASIKNRKFSFSRHLFVFSPQETMIKFLRCRFFEMCDSDPLGVNSLKDPVYDSVFATSIHCLKNN